MFLVDLNLLILQKNIKNIYLILLSLKGYSKLFLIFYFLFSFFIFDISKAEINNLTKSKNNKIGIEYLESKNELDDYIIDSGDVLSINFQFKIFNGVYLVSTEGQLSLPEIDEIYVRGLTTSELKSLLEKRYSDILIDPEIKVRIAVFRETRVLIDGELRNPGFYNFPAYSSKDTSILARLGTSDQLKNPVFYNFPADSSTDTYNQSSEKFLSKINNSGIVTISSLIRRAGGITSETDLSRIEIIRNVPLGKGGGKKIAIIDLNAYINEGDHTNDIRIFDGDTIFFPKLNKPIPNQIPKSIVSGISPQFITVNIFGRVETPGLVKLPLQASLSDAIDLTGPIKPLYGKVVLIRYEKDGSLIKKKISYSARAARGSKRNPYLKEYDLIAVRNSFFGKATGIIKEVTAPFFGIYTTKELLEDFSD